ncbi:hypothetical protein AAKU64_001911 [Undibacterium sp. GrIS 1.8]|uniref:DUF1302 domain-containing protein n=1 Tax=Undibacterium sp. GrIS 1.8 TaxID=3143934 RepID=UPI00339991CA
MQKSSSKRKLRLVLNQCALAGVALSAVASHAGEIKVDNPDLTLRFDNTVKASTIYRLNDADSILTNSFSPSGAPQALNLNAGDQNFRKRGFVSERVDLLSEFDLVFQRKYGLRVSAAAWYDQAYNRKTDALNDPTVGQVPYNEFPDYTRKIAGSKAEVLDAFVFGSTDLGNAGKLTARLGQHTILYGESLFFGDNGVAAAQGPVDINKLLSSPNAQFKEIAMPVPQLSAQWQIQPNISLGGYVQFRWKESRVPPSGSYFSTANVPWNATGPEFVNIPAFAGPVAGSYVASPGANVRPGNNGQFGLQLKWRIDETDLSFFYAKYNDKFGQLYSRLNPGAKTTDSQWFYVFGSDIKVAGMSASRSIGDFNVSAEASVRDNMALTVNNAVYFGPASAPRPINPTGRTAHFNLSMLGSFGANFLAQESGLVAELAWNRVLSKTDPQNEIDQGRTRDASIVQLIYTPTYRQVLPGLDLSVPVGARYSLDSRSSVTAWGAKGTGNANIGLEGNYLNTWQFAMNYTRYIGDSKPYNDYALGQFSDGNPLGDRNYISLSVRRTF